MKDVGGRKKGGSLAESEYFQHLLFSQCSQQRITILTLFAFSKRMLSIQEQAILS